MFITQWESEKSIISSDEEMCDSDEIDSDIEAELYSTIHHQQEIATVINTNSVESSDKVVTEALSLNDVIHEEKLRDSILKIEDSFNLDDDSCLDKNFESQKKSCTLITLNDNFLKRKTDFVTNVLENIQSTKKQKKEKYKTSKEIFKKINQKSNEVINLESSDSDISWTDNSYEKKDFKTNLSHPAINLESDSECSDSLFYKFSNQDISSIPRSKITKDLRDPWYINENDLYRNRRSSGRYHESKMITCNSCNQKGHLARHCSVFKPLKCYICGSNHRPSFCKMQTCGNCFRFGHSVKQCKKPISFCHSCKMTGHSYKECPEIWRQYHITTTNKFIPTKRLYQDSPLYCYNCGSPGHFGAECTGSRMNMLSFPTWPVILNRKAKGNLIFPKRNGKKTKRSTNFKENSFKKTSQSFVDKFCEQKKDSSQKRKRKRKRNKKNIPISGNPEENVQHNFPRTPKANKQPQSGCESSNSFPNTKRKTKSFLKAKRRIKKLLALQNSPFESFDKV